MWFWFGALSLWPAAWAGHGPGGLALHQCTWKCCLGSALSWCCDGLLMGLAVLRWPFVSREQSHCACSGSASCVLTYWGSAAPLLSLLSFYNYTRNHCGATRNFFKVVYSDFAPVWNSKTALAVFRELFWGMLGRGDWGLRGIWVSGSGHNEVLALEVLNVVDCVGRKRRAQLLVSASAPCTVAAALLFQACVRACKCTCCICVCIYMCIVCIYIRDDV